MKEIQGRAIEIFEKRNRAFRILYDTVVEVNQAEIKEIYKILTKNLCNISSASLTCLFSVTKEKIKLEAISGIEGKIFLSPEKGNLEEFINKFVKMQFSEKVNEESPENSHKKHDSQFEVYKSINIDEWEKISTNEIQKLSKNSFILDYLLNDLKIPIVNLNTSYALKCMQKEKNIAVAVLLYQGDKDIYMKDMIDTFMHLSNLTIQRVHAFMEIKNSNEKFQILLTNSPAGILLVNKDKTIVEINNAAIKMLQADRDQVLGSKCNKIFCIETNNICPIFDLKKESLETEMEVKRFDGGKISVLKHAVTVGIQGEEYIIETFVDLSEVKKMQKEKDLMQQQLHQASRLASVGELAGGIAHELNNPLAVISSYIDQIEDELKDEKLHNEYVDKSIIGINKSIKRMVSIINHVKSFASARKEEVMLLNINEIIDSSFSLFGKQLEKCNIKIIKQYSDEELLVIGDQNQLEQVFINLLVNARDAMKEFEDKRIEILTKKEKKNIVVSVRDTGSGISKDALERLFDPFFTTKNPGEGTGLGLSISYSIITEHKGKITAKNSIDGGAIFTVSLPQTDAI